MSLKINKIVSDSVLNVSCITNFNSDIYSSASFLIENNCSLLINSSDLLFRDNSNLTKYGIKNCNISSNNMPNSIETYREVLPYYAARLTDSNGNTAEASIGCQPFENNAVCGVLLTNFGQQLQLATTQLITSASFTINTSNNSLIIADGTALNVSGTTGINGNFLISTGKGIKWSTGVQSGISINSIESVIQPLSSGTILFTTPYEIDVIPSVQVTPILLNSSSYITISTIRYDSFDWISNVPIDSVSWFSIYN